jgi:hypothetical protein
MKLSTVKAIFDGLKSTLRTRLINLSQVDALRNTAHSPRHDDLYVVSFPKSGATWMNFLMANLHLQMSGIERTVTFFNVHDFIPDVQTTRYIGNSTLSFPGYRVMKSHSDFNSNYLKVIYVVRDPRDTLVSYFHFLTSLGQFDGTLSELVRSPEFGISAWVRHTQGWLNSPASLSIEFLRYEDLLSKPDQVLQRVYKLLGHNIPESALQAAIEASSFTNMRQSELEWNYGGRPTILDKEMKFMRSGRSGDGKQSLSAADLDHIWAAASSVMAHFSYSR